MGDPARYGGDTVKKHYKILLFLLIGLGVFFLLWTADGRPVFTPQMAMRRTEHSFLLEDTEQLVCHPTYRYGPEPRYDFVTTDGACLYYGQAQGDGLTYWNDFGRWTVSDFHRNSKGETVSYISGQTATLSYYDPADDLRCECEVVPFYIFTEDIEFDALHGLLEIEYTDLLDALPGTHTFQFSDTAEAVGQGHVLWFGRYQMTVKDQPAFVPHRLDESSLDNLWFYLDPAYNRTTLTITLYKEGREVYTETMTLTGQYEPDWR